MKDKYSLTISKFIICLLSLFLMVLTFNFNVHKIDASVEALVIKKETTGKVIQEDFTFFIKAYGKSKSNIDVEIDYEPGAPGIPITCYIQEFQIPSGVSEITIRITNSNYTWSVGDAQTINVDVSIDYGTSTQKQFIKKSEGVYELVLSGLSGNESISISDYFALDNTDPNNLSIAGIFEVFYEGGETLLDLSSELGQEVEEGIYSFTLKSNTEAKYITSISKGCNYEVWEADKVGWTLVSVDGDTTKTKASGIYNGSNTHTFVNETKNYTVQYYYQIEGIYQLIDTEKRNALVGSEVKANDEDLIAKEEYYIFDENNDNNNLKGNVDGDGLTTLKIYFKQQIPLTFELNGGIYGEQTEDIIKLCDYGETIEIISAPEKEGFQFLYWKGSIYYPGQLYEVKEAHSFVAQWKEIINEDPKPSTNTNPRNVPDTSAK